MAQGLNRVTTGRSAPLQISGEPDSVNEGLSEESNCSLVDVSVARPRTEQEVI